MVKIISRNSLIQPSLSFLVVALSLLAPTHAGAAECSAVFSDGVQSNDSGGNIKLKDNAQIINSPDGVLDTTSISASGNSSCGSPTCTASGSPAESGSFSSFPGGANITSSQTLAPGDYGKLDTDGDVVFSSGDYTFDGKFKLSDGGTLTISGSGTVRIYVSNNVDFKDNVSVNQSGSADQLFIYSDNNTTLKDNAQLVGFLYATNKLTLKGNAIVTGAVSGKKVKLSDNSAVTFDTSARDNADFDSFCEALIAGPDHFLINHDSVGIHCLAESMTVSAKNSDDTTMAGYTGTITLDTQTGKGSWSKVTGAGTFSDSTLNDGLATYTFAAADNGVGIFSLYYPEGTATFNIDAYEGAVRDDDTEGNISFAASGFTVTASALSNPPPATINDPIGTQTAGTAFNLYLAAYGTTPTDSECGVIETYSGSKSIALTTTRVNPSSGTISATGGGATTFTNGQAVISAKYKDAGSIGQTVSDGTISGGSNNFVVRPASLVITLGGGNQTATDHTGTVYTTAGSSFAVTVAAKDSEGATTPNFGNESPAETVALAHTLAAPSGGASGSLSGSLSRTGDGIFSGSYNWSEVGIINLNADISDGSYLGTGNITANLNNVGRFTPHQFALGGFSNGSLEDVCIASLFTYTGESFDYNSTPEFIVTAQNSAGATTTNYTGNYAKLNAASANLPAVTADSTTNGADGSTPMVIAHTQAAKLVADNGNGTHTYTLGADSFQYTRNANAEVGAFNSDIELSIVSVTDNDSVITTFSSGNMLLPTSTNIRYGRLSIANALGSELVNLQMPVTLEIYDSSLGDFVPHSDDTCTTAPAFALSDPDASDGLDATTLSSSISANNGGRFDLTLNAPGVGSQGTALVTLNAPSHLEYNRGSVTDPEPSAIGTFGLYSGNPVIIYQREIR